MDNSQLRVLVVDDEPGLLLSLVAFLEDMDFQAYAAHSGTECLRLLHRIVFDVCIIDIRLPDIDGNEIIIAARKSGMETVFLIHTGSTDYQLPNSLVKLGFRQDDVFLKPVSDINNLCQAFKNKLAVQQSQKDLGHVSPDNTKFSPQ